MPRSKLAAVLDWAQSRRAALRKNWDLIAALRPPEKIVSQALHITSAAPVIHGVLKLVRDDGYEGVIDLRGTIADGQMFEHIRRPENFRNVRVSRCGHSIYWGEEDNEFVDFGCDNLRALAEEQAALLVRAASEETFS
jgi:hypothetical protein